MMKSYFKFLSRNKMYTFIELFGLSIALTAVLLIYNYVRDELTMDDFQPRVEDTFLMGNERMGLGNIATARRLQEKYPEVEATCPVASLSNMLGNGSLKVGETEVFYIPMMVADSCFFHFFNFPLLEGDASQVLATPSQVVISRSMANLYFANGESPIGQIISLSGFQFTISGIMEDMRHTMLPKADMVVNIDFFNDKHWSRGRDEFNNATNCLLFVRQKPGTDITARAQDIAAWFKEFFWFYKNEFVKEVRFLPMKEAHFDSRTYYGELETTSRSFVNILLMSGLAILLFAFINYINLTAAQTGYRAKEMATRRLLGSSRGAIIARYIGEATLLTALSFIIAWFLAIGLQKPFNELVDGHVDIEASLSTCSLWVYLAAIVVIGATVGIIPALAVSKFKAIDVMKGDFRRRSKQTFDRAFILVQNVLTVALLAFALCCYLQFRHLLNQPRGFQTENTLIVTANRPGVLKAELEKLPCVQSAAIDREGPLGSSNNNSFIYHDHQCAVNSFSGTMDAFRLWGYEIVRQIQEPTQGMIWITEACLKQFDLREDSVEMGELLGVFQNSRTGEQAKGVCGIIRNVQNHPLITPYNYFFMVDDDLQSESWGRVIVRTTDESAATKAAISQVVNDFYEHEIPVSYVKELLREQLQEMDRTRTIVLLMGIIAVILSSLGMLAMSTYYTRRNVKEVAIRKVFGSSPEEEFVRLATRFLRIVLIAFVVALPLSWWLINRWLQDYADRIGGTWLIILAAGMAALLFAALTICAQTAKAARTNPQEALKKE